MLVYSWISENLFRRNVISTKVKARSNPDDTTIESIESSFELIVVISVISLS